MGYDFHALNEDVEDFHLGAFSWSWMLDAGVGLVLKTGAGFKPATYRYEPRDGKSPQANDGFAVTAEEAKMMSVCARGLVAIEEGRRDEWNALSEEERKLYEDVSTRPRWVQRLPVREDFVEKAARFADWAEKSGGFTIH